jgi:NTE family protein
LIKKIVYFCTKVHKLRTNSRLKFIVFLLFSVFTAFPSFSQKVGLVLSGGGATGFAHIGVIKALEERGIPIDYITGTSAGALVGSMYAIGYSPAEIEAYVLSERFQLMSNGKLERSQEFLFQKDDEDASLIDLAFSKDSILKKSLPTNFIRPTLMDFEMMFVLGTNGASRGENFDSLFIPFRCVAADIYNKKSVVFSHGKLNQAVRASMTYPFFVNPIRVDGQLLFDGGLYNNFPTDVMYNDFSPDYMIGSNVAGNAKPPAEDDLLAQLRSMLVSYTNFDLPCTEGIVIRPVTNIGTFEFENIEEAIQDGYLSTLKYLDSIEIHVARKVSKEELTAKRAAFKKKIFELNISSVNTYSLNKTDESFVRKSILKNTKNQIITPELLTKRYFRTAAIQQIDYLLPTITLKPDSTFNLDLLVRKTKDFKLEVGGHFSSRSINTGYIGLTYYNLSKVAIKVKGESYFGKFYASVKTSLDLQLPLYYPVSISPYFVLNRWDYYRSSSTFFEDIKPSFLVQNELYFGLKLKHPLGNNSKSVFDIRKFQLKDDYYQTQNFTSIDTADYTQFFGETASWQIENNSLNRKQFASSGHYFSFKARYVQGKERSISGSTSLTKYDLNKNHKWINLEAEAQSFLINNYIFHLGVHAKAIMNSQSLFSNYKASILSTTAFSPTPDAATFFLEDYRAPQHAGIGTNFIFSIKKSIDIRFDGYIYQPFKQIKLNEDGTIYYSRPPLKGGTYLAAASVIYHSPFGPIRFTANYFPKQKTPFYFQFSYGYVLFNERAIR